MAARHDEKNPLEWSVFGVGCALTLTTVAALGYELATRKPSSGPVPVIRLGPAERQDDGYAVPVTVVNRGDATAEGVRIEVLHMRPDGDEERAGFEVQYLPGHGSRRGRVTFSTDPAAGRLTARATGYEVP